MESGRDEEFFQTHEAARNAIADWARPVVRLACSVILPERGSGYKARELRAGTHFTPRKGIAASTSRTCGYSIFL
jgi:hypothetical protein